MIQTAQDNDLMQHLAALARRRGVPAPAGTPAAEYDWACPYRFPRSEIVRLEQLGKTVAREMAHVLTQLLHSEQHLVSAPFTQHYANTIADASADQSDYWVELSRDGKPRGLLAVPAEVALNWVGRLLGGSGKAEARRLSALEESLLQDLLMAAIGGLCEALKLVGGKPVQAGAALRRGKYELPGDAWDDFGLLDFTAPALDAAGAPLAQQPAPTQPAKPVLRCLFDNDLLEELILPTGAAADEASAGPSSEECRERMLAHAHRMSATATVYVGAMQVHMRDLMSLRPGDVLLLDQRADQPVEVQVDGRVMFTALAAKSQGKYAAQIVTLRCGNEEDPAHALPGKGKDARHDRSSR